MKLIFLGPPGAGKGTLADRAVEFLKLPHISTGAIFRSAIAERKMAPVLICGSLRKSTALSARVPLPAPGGPKKISFIYCSFILI